MNIYEAVESAITPRQKEDLASIIITHIAKKYPTNKAFRNANEQIQNNARIEVYTISLNKRDISLDIEINGKLFTQSVLLTDLEDMEILVLDK